MTRIFDNIHHQLGPHTLIAVARSPAAPHAVLVNEGLRYPMRNGSTTRYLSEPEVATAYRNRLTAVERQASRASEVERDAVQGLDYDELAWVLVSLVPDSAGSLPITREQFVKFQQGILGTEHLCHPERFSDAEGKSAPWAAVG